MLCAPTLPNLQWDIFCRVIDNFGDIGVCWRLAVNLAGRGQRVRLWVDDASALQWMAPAGEPGVEVRVWTTPLYLDGITPGDVLIEAFGCEIDPEFIAAYAGDLRTSGKKCAWINLEYLSAEPYARRCHGLPSPVANGPSQGLTKHFFYPGFTPDSGGLLREPDLMARQATFNRRAWLAQQGVDWRGERLISLFCYEPAGLPALLQQCAGADTPTRLLVTAGRAQAAVQRWLDEQNRLQPNWNKREKLRFSYLPALTQNDFDRLLWSCDLNTVRGEDSLVRALWAGQPFLWQIYPQQDDAHHAKLNAFLDWLDAPASLRQAHSCWNAIDANAPLPPLLGANTLACWQTCVVAARTRVLEQDDLTHRLLVFAANPTQR